MMFAGCSHDASLLAFGHVCKCCSYDKKHGVHVRSPLESFRYGICVLTDRMVRASVSQ
jgi:hypothetical protein